MGIFSKDRNEYGGVGTWSFESKSDPRWNYCAQSAGMWAAMEEAKRYVEAQKPHLGEPPADLEYGWAKW